MTEAKNLGIAQFTALLAEKPESLKMSTDRMQVRLGFRAPRSLAELFASVFVDETLLASVESNLRKDHIFVEHKIEENPSWRTPTKPAGEMRNMGRLAHLPKANALLTVTVCIPYLENGTEQLYVIGSAEYDAVSI